MARDAVLYERLGVRPEATVAEIKRAYRKAALEWHPDRNKDDPDAAERFKECLEAYEILTDAEKRATYDANGLDGLSRSPSPSRDSPDVQPARYASGDFMHESEDDYFDGDYFDGDYFHRTASFGQPSRRRQASQPGGFHFQASWSFNLGGGGTRSTTWSSSSRGGDMFGDSWGFGNVFSQFERFTGIFEHMQNMHETIARSMPPPSLPTAFFGAPVQSFPSNPIGGSNNATQSRSSRYDSSRSERSRSRRRETLAKVFDSFGDCRVLLIGDASHGTSEFYAARAEITKHMIEHHGFNVVAVEADWPDAEAVDRYVRRRPGRTASVEPAVAAAAKEGSRREPAFMRFPTWMWRKRLEYAAARGDGEEFHGGAQNARLVADAEYYYRAMYYARDESWNLRDTHMFQTLNCALVWAHNSHVGDARATSTGWSRGELNLGQLCREAYGRGSGSAGGGALNIGMGTYAGTVAAAHRWDGDMRVMRVRPGLAGSYEELMHAVGALREALRRKRLERFIGVIYRPDTELQSHYASAVLPEQFDGLVRFDETRHVGALEVHQPRSSLGLDETWPFGL